MFREGFHFYANRDCFIKIYHIDVNQEMSLIFPNQVYSNNRIDAKRVYKIPDRTYPFTFELSAPYGVEFIKVIASVLQFKDIEASFEELGTVQKGFVTRGLNVKVKKEQIAEVLINYTIIK